ncbi:peptide-methionine (S)-S-oxide reductase MsrA [Fulvivirga sp. M361]|uniref:peptide-methionine (S)-S-oxide reductase MsrA n=1 Tax=Fulvivirga sp. M361 TaxID=2594266 RepID=UPI00117B5A28|nr:peptide-methionine (S)-S-oxide reductase MsrA [Fulvivirga sp. M361]TRX58718.1 peptide-methionine (S)-S-oxide reductase MsrA [Fulvivirga sp. M361]
MNKLRFLLIPAFCLLFASCSGGNQNTAQTVVPISAEHAEKLDTAYFASGCFWCTEAVFERVKGVYDVVSGYSGGKEKNPTYRQVSAGITSHAEAVRVLYDPQEVSYTSLVEIFFGSHDPTTLNRQGPDVGTQYRSAIYYSNSHEKQIAEKIKSELDDKGTFSNPIVTEITAFSSFYDAEDYHQNYYELNPNQPYILSVSKPKVEKFKKAFKNRLKEAYK